MSLEGCPLTPSELERVGSFVWRGPAGETLELELDSVRGVHRGLLVAFAAYRDRDRAGELSRGELLAEADRLPDPGPGVAYAFQLVGLDVQDEAGRRLGRLADIWSTGAHPIYVVQGERELLVPAHPGVVKQVDLEARVITVALPAGLEDL
jgi:16S rRNA processing protein RimM